MRKFLVKEVGDDSVDIELEARNFKAAAERVGRIFELETVSVVKDADEVLWKRKFIVSDVESGEVNIVY